jgi:hypothetical protein
MHKVYREPRRDFEIQLIQCSLYFPQMFVQLALKLLHKSWTLYFLINHAYKLISNEISYLYNIFESINDF